uniref:OCRE domain-containing protein n=1 Tax=Coccolithus braarudii TaxID=221442 RepID=A0A7S0Q966_9EUKA|mmetsp:Transcript_50597/g.108052  ORF Transcript_50597/g.108052 Transcript_50597/m.108052 type:complete len:412 (+) Transcript_50597:346-1581(+)|eukprot:CAMPEP_0183382044 /NCGR_PEP_ID=MMETSP0164_2-20130417/126741_1 /TAXON_ID=221442 /ORGANISM="Coccolithus pelagicus ssp braarudi, Strain PLY182g" /LENGTH=411 /DNA_ID=CAMNT_0025559655 /DNA_START=2048 /DNA_END=3283 /DNA_ORIENTATION=-
MADRERVSFAYLADKFNTQAPPGYVPGRGRGISGFSKPPAEPTKRGSRPPPAACNNDGVAGSKASSRLEADAADTRELDLGETEAFEQDETSMDQKEAGSAIEPFNMKQERREGHFDDDFNYVWKDKGEDNEIHDAWLGEVDEAGESEEKVKKRRKLLAMQMGALQKQDEAPPDVPALAAEVVMLLQPKETVAAAMRRLGPTKKGAHTGRGARARAAPAPPPPQVDEAAERQRAAQFAALTEATDKLLRAGRFDIFSERREVLDELAGGAVAAAAAAASSGGSVLPNGVSQEMHDAVVAGGYALDTTSGYYYSESSGLCFDVLSGLYWSPDEGGMGTYYRYDADAAQFVPVGQGASGSQETGGEPGGEEVGEAAGEVAGEEVGEEAGEAAGDESGQEAGEESGQEAGQETG